MAKLLKIKDYLRLGLAFSGDLAHDFQDPFGFMERGCQEMYGWVPPKYRKSSQLARTWELLTTGSIEKIIKNGEVYYRLTSIGKKNLLRDYPLLVLRNRKWDGGWTMVIFDIPEEKRKRRDLLREKLLELGLGMMQKSVYITPYDLSEDIREFLIANHLGEEAYVTRIKKLFAGNPKKLASKLWNLEGVNESYKKIVTACVEGEKSGFKDEEKNKIKSQYVEVLVKDPYLPKELLFSDWMGDKARSCVSRLTKFYTIVEKIEWLGSWF